MPEQDDIFYMQRALQLARLGQYTARPNPLVGAVIVKNNHIVGEGCHWQAGKAHAEINALEMAKENAIGATAYVTLEPCAHWGRTGPCYAALIQSGIKRVVIAGLDPNPLVSGKGKLALEEAGIEVLVGVCEREALLLNKGFFLRMQSARPYVRAKVAMSLDGRLALKCGKSQWITGELARKDAHFERARSGGILTGSQTVQKDNCRLTAREELNMLPKEISFEQPWRLLIDSDTRCEFDAAIFDNASKTSVFITKKSMPKDKRIDYIVLAEKDNKVDLEALLAWCAKAEINDLWVEAGSILTGALIQAGLVDELVTYIAPTFLGHEGKPMAILGIQDLHEISGHFAHVEHLGHDLKITLHLSEFARSFYDS